MEAFSVFYIWEIWTNDNNDNNERVKIHSGRRRQFGFSFDHLPFDFWTGGNVFPWNIHGVEHVWWRDNAGKRRHRTTICCQYNLFSLYFTVSIGVAHVFLRMEYGWVQASTLTICIFGRFRGENPSRCAALAGGSRETRRIECVSPNAKVDSSESDSVNASSIRRDLKKKPKRVLC